MRRLARLRVPLGFVTAAIAVAFARPTWASWGIGLAVALVGEGLRLWAAGHLEKGREITNSGPYRFVRHPLYLGSSLLGIGFVVASRSLVVAAITALYLAVTLGAAILIEEATLDEKFGGRYSDYRDGRVEAVARPFSWARARRNREHRAMAGLIAVFLFLLWRVGR